MNFGRGKGNEVTRPGESARKKSTARPRPEVIDASPGEAPPSQGKETWQKTTAGVAGLWGNYRTLLKNSFQRMNQEEQMELILKASRVLAIGAAVIALGLVYYFLNITIRVIVVPLLLVGAWFFGSRIIAPYLATLLDAQIHKE